MSDLLFQKTIGSVETVKGFQPIHIPVLSDLPVVGEVLFQHNILVYLAFLLVPVSWFVLNKTTLGLKIRAVGENPEAADSLGVSVKGIRYFTCILGGTFSGIAGASLSIALLNVFQQNLTSGQGLYCGRTGIFWWLAPIGSNVGLTAVQYGKLIAVMGAGAQHTNTFGYCGDDAIRV